MKSVLISIQPKWCELIASGKKTVEVRKSRPKLEAPFKVYIYETKGRTEIPTFIDEDGHEIYQGRGQVIGEFVCETMTYAISGDYCILPKSKTLIDELDLLDYADGKPLYGWHISDLVIYDKPRELSEFKTVCEGLKPYQCDKCEYSYTESNESIGVYHGCGCDNLKPLKRPPQSWCYVESEVQGE